MSGSSDVVAIVLAAGRGTRFGESPKLLADLDGKPIVRHAVEAALAACLRTLVILGHRGAEMRAALDDLPVLFVDSLAYADGLSTSLKAGFASLPSSAAAAIILLGDMPNVTPELLHRLVSTWNDEVRPSAVIPISSGHRGNPVLLSRALAPVIGRLTGDTGAGPLLRGLANVVEVPVDDAGITIDIDTPETLAWVRGRSAS